MKGSRECSRILVYLVAISLPSNITTFVAPLFEIPAHMCTFKVCLGLGFNFLGCQRSVDCGVLFEPMIRLKRWHYQTVPFCLRTWSLVHSNLFSILTLRISWQYRGGVLVHPRFKCWHTIVAFETFKLGNSNLISLARSRVVSSSFSDILSSISTCSCWSMDGRPLLGQSSTDPVNRYLSIVFATVCL